MKIPFNVSLVLAFFTALVLPIVVIVPVLGRLIKSGNFANATELFSGAVKNISLTDLLSLIQRKGLDGTSALHCYLAK